MNVMTNLFQRLILATEEVGHTADDGHSAVEVGIDSGPLVEWAWLIVVVPLVAAFLIMFFGKKMPWKGWEIAWGAIAFVGVYGTVLFVLNATQGVLYEGTVEIATIGTNAFGELDRLSFAERLKRRVLYGRVVEEQFAPLTLDEPKTFFGNQFFDCALWHILNYSLKQNGKRKQTVVAQRPDTSRQSGARVTRAWATKSTAIQEAFVASHHGATGT